MFLKMISYKAWEGYVKTTKYWKLNNPLLNNPWIKEEILKEIRQYFERNDNKNKRRQDVWIASKLMLEGNVMVLNILNTMTKRSNVCIKK